MSDNDNRSLEQKFEQDVIPRLGKKEARIAKEFLGEYTHEKSERMRLTIKWMRLHKSIEEMGRKCLCDQLKEDSFEGDWEDGTVYTRPEPKVVRTIKAKIKFVGRRKPLPYVEDEY